MTFEHFAGQPEADVEDIIGAKNYVELVNRAYGVVGADLMTMPATLPPRIVKSAEAHFRTVKASIPEFDHYAPSRYFCENQAAVMVSLPEIDARQVRGDFQSSEPDDCVGDEIIFRAKP